MHRLIFTALFIGNCFLMQAQNQNPENGKFQLLKLPYTTDALAPKISKQTMELHWGKHVQTYIDNVNKLVAGTPFENLSLEDIIKKADGPLYNNAAQVWNHNLFFSIMSPKPQKSPGGELKTAIDKTFGSFDNFKSEFAKSGASLFGSGWVWLVRKTDGTLAIIQTNNAGCPVKDGMYPLVNCDVWEHAYYLDYQNKRADYINAFWDLIDWKTVEKRFETASNKK